MSSNGFSLDPRTVLGVSSGATADEIREAYHAKSKKHHPDAGGDEWAFRMVARAYEILTTTAPSQSAQRFAAYTSEEPPAPTGDAGERSEKPDGIQNVNVELIWTRYERNSAGASSSLQEADDQTLSVCMVISWPPHALVDRVVDFPSSGETLHTLIELFETLRSRGSVIAARSKIEDGRFVAWLSYPDVPTAGDTFLFIREALKPRGLTPKLQTRDVVLPFQESA